MIQSDAAMSATESSPIHRVSSDAHAAAATAPRLEPVPRHWRADLVRFWRGYLPTAVFLAAIVLATFLWQRQSGRITVPGEVDPAANSIVTFLRRDQRFRPAPGLPVEIRLCSDPRKVYFSQIQSVGAQAQAIPEQLLRNHKNPEWGLPVRIAMPPQTDLRPGEPVDVILKSPTP